ncbi:MAG: CHAT domain-containing protein [Candidatus Tectomicrobia bacterium]
MKQSLPYALWLCLSTLCLPMSSAPAWAAASSTPAALSPQHYMAQGLASFQRGDFAQAVSSWQEAARLYEHAQQLSAQSRALTHLSQAYQALGQYRDALASLEVALSRAEQSADRAQIASALGSLGHASTVTGALEKAQPYLHRALGLARELGHAALTASILNNLGNLFMSQDEPTRALVAYRESATLARQTERPALAARALSNAAMASRQREQYREAKALLDEALEQTRGLPVTLAKAHDLLNIGLAYRDLRLHLPGTEDDLLLLTAEIFNQAAVIAQTGGNPRAASYAWGYLGRLYEGEHRYQEALQLTRRAVFAAQQVYAPEALYRWQWQTGRLLNALGNTDAAIAAYRQAVDTLQSIRQELSRGYGRPQASFRESVGAVFFELVDLLLHRAASLQARERVEPYLIEARAAVEMLKVAELRDYFQDDCVDAARSKVAQLDVVSQTAAVVYPILLPDRTELLVTLPTGLKRFAVPVTAATLTQEVREFRRKLEKRTTRQYLPHAQKLYDWLVRPLIPDLTSLAIDTLVFVPDGPLRTIPMAALHNGEQFLISTYAVAITPGLSLTDPRPLPRQRIKVLAMGLTESVQGFPSLPNVSTELQAVHNLYPGRLLLNQDFLVTNIEQELQDEQFTIVHIASHGQFASDVAASFILTFDDKLTLDRLDRFVGLFRFRDEPLELLTLSACQTAAGDDRAALGLAGIAIKAGARSALATLWYINDQASSELVAEFYRQLQQPTVSRAVALQRAQLKLLNDRRYRHPGYWSPFLLINNWL